MRQSRVNAKWALGTLALVLALPVIAQEAPESLLPPGFGESPTAPPPASGPQPGRPPAGPVAPAPMVQPLPSSPSDMSALSDNATANAAEAQLSEEELAAQKAKYDLPEGARRSLDRVGPLTPHLADARACPAARDLAARVLTLPTHRKIAGAQRERLLEALGR